MKCLFWEQLSVLLIHIAMEQGAGGSPALNPQNLAHRFILYSPTERQRSSKKMEEATLLLLR